jgi:4-hydroxy-3-polyprenylbenzoate decarboxylase
MDKFSMLKNLFSLKNVFPKRLNSSGEAQEIIKLGDDVNLFDLPILTTWEQDGGAFITMGQIYTQNLNGDKKNLGMYRLQIYDKNTLGLHWQIHKDSNHFFHEYKKAGKKMPVSIAIGGDPLYTYCGTAPLPIGIFELMLYGFIKNESAKLIKCKTNELYIPHDVDFVIEGFVDPSKSRIEGPFGDHTGYYTLEEEYPYLEVTAITSKKEPIYLATVVGKPPLEDKYMGYATERVFLPLLKTNAPDLIDYHMPENGVFHNLILAKISPLYPAHSKQIMHTFWGVGQMSFVKHSIFVDESAPNLTDYESISDFILNRVSPDRLLITEGICDALDHSSDKFAEGGKMGIDCVGDEVELNIKQIDDSDLLKMAKELDSDIVNLKQLKTHTKNPITVITVDKTKNQKYTIAKLRVLKPYCKIIAIVDNAKNDLNNSYMLLWRVVNNIDSKRDVVIDENLILIDATDKNSLDNFPRRWPDDVTCTKEVIESLQSRGLIDIDEEFISKFGLL